MIRITAILFFVSTTYLIKAQSDMSRYELLYEITHPEFAGSSYVFGSCHLNDPRIFNFSDSIYEAFTSCSVFAGELQIDSFNLEMIDTFKENFLGVGELDSISEDSQNDGSIEKYFDPNGMPTFLDAYLSHAAKNHGMEILGLERMEDQDKILDALETETEEFYFGHPLYEEFLEWYLIGNLSEESDPFSDLESYEKYDMENRNRIQSESIFKISKEKKLFAVVGAGHMAGKNNVLDILKSAGCTLRKVNFGKKTDQIQKLYDSHSSILNSDNISSKINQRLTISSPIKMELFAENPEMIMKGSGDISLGCFWADMILPIFPDQNTDLSEIIKRFVPDTSNIKFVGESKNDISEMKEFYYNDSTINAGYRIHRSDRMLVLQMNITFARPTLEYLKEELRYSQLQFSKIEVVSKIEVNEKYGVEYYFPLKKGYSLNTPYYNTDTAAGKTFIEYKTAYNTVSGDEYMLQLSQLPAQYIYQDIDKSFTLTSNNFVDKLGLEVTSVDSIISNNVRGVYSECQLKSDPNVKVFFKFFLRGNQSYVIMNYARSGNRDDKFMNAFKCQDLKIAKFTNQRIEDLTLSFDSPSHEIKPKAENEVKEWLLVDSSFASTIVISEMDFGQYESYNYHEDSLVTHANEFKKEVDSVLMYEGVYVDGILMGQQTIYKQKNHAILYGELLLYYGKGGAQIVVFAPQTEGAVDYIKRIFDSVKIDNPKEQKEIIARDKEELFFQHLSSSDSTLQKQAEIHSNYFSFDSTHLEILYGILEGQVYDENATNSFKHSLLKSVINLPFNLDRIIKIYNKQSNLHTKKTIIEQLLLTRETKNIELAFELFASEKSELPTMYGYRYSVFADSLEMFIMFRDDLLKLVERNINKSDIIPLFAMNLPQMGHTPNYIADSTMVADYYTQYTQNQCDSLIRDSTYYLPDDLFNYYNENKEHPGYEIMNSTINEHGTTYEKFQLYKTIISRGDKLPMSLSIELLEDYKYYTKVYQEYLSRDQLDKLPKKYKNKDFSVLMSARSHLNDYGYYSKNQGSKLLSYEMVSVGKSKEEMAFVQIALDDYESSLFALVGPLTKEGFIDLDSDISTVYYSEDQNETEENILNNLKSQINSK